jgi:hypothetical protein
VRPEGLGKLKKKNSFTSSGLEPACKRRILNSTKFHERVSRSSHKYKHYGSHERDAVQVREFVSTFRMNALSPSSG